MEKKINVLKKIYVIPNICTTVVNDMIIGLKRYEAECSFLRRWKCMEYSC